MIGDVEIPNRTVPSPHGRSDQLSLPDHCERTGAGLVVMEMVSDKGIQYNNEKTLHMLHIDEGENPVSIQLFGSDEDSQARAAEFIQENTKTDIVDINMGCPVNKIVKNEAGAMWLKDPDKIYSIINKVQSVLDIPSLLKCGQVGLTLLAVENALAAEAAGVSAPAMHGRTQEQMYTGHADLETLHKVATSSDQDSIYRKRRYPYGSRCQTTDRRSRCRCGHDWSCCYGQSLSLQPNQPLL